MAFKLISRQFRRIVFWIHLVAGLITGAVIAIMSVTGIAIAFEEETLEWFDRKERVLQSVPAPQTSPLSLNDLRKRVEAEHPSFHVSSAAIYSDSRRTWEFHGDHEGPLYVDPFTGAMRESRAHTAQEVIHKLEEWHRWLGAKDGQTSIGRLITGISNVAFVVLCVTGLWLWFPRKWSSRALRPLIRLIPTYRGKARDFNRHNVFGFWSMPVLLVLSATGVVISFEWGHRLVFTLAGEEAPESRNYGMMAVPPPVVAAPVEGASRVSFETAIARVGEVFPEWESITLEFPHETESTAAPLDFGVTVPDYMPSRGYIPVKSDPFTGEVLQSVRFEDRSPGLQARVWARFLHTGEAFGLTGKIIAVLGSAASLVLVWTGFTLSWRRFIGKRIQPEPNA